MAIHERHADGSDSSNQVEHENKTVDDGFPLITVFIMVV